MASAAVGTAVVSVKVVVPAATGAISVAADGVKPWKTLRWTWYSARSLPGSPVVLV